jgi:hypothetical protein
MSESPETQNQSADSSGDAGEDPSKDGRITDDMLPEDLQPTDDNPLAKPPSDDDDEDSGMSLGPDGPQG